MQNLAIVFAITALTRLASPAPIAAGPLSLLAKAAKLGAKAGKAAKLAKGAKAAKLVGAAGAALAAERAATLFARTGDDLGRGAAYLARESGGDYLLIVKHGASEIKTANPSEALAALPHENIDLYVDLSAAQRSAALPQPSGNGRLFVLDADAQPHPLRVERRENGTTDYIVDHAGDAVDLSSFVQEQISDETESDEPPLAFMLVMPTLVGVGLIGWFWLQRRKRKQREAAQS